MIFFTIAMEKWLKYVRFLTVKSSFKSVALSFLLVAAFFFNTPASFADKQFFASEYISPPLRVVNTYVDHGSAALIEAALSAVSVDLVVRSVEAVSHSELLDVLISGGNSAPPDYQFLGTLIEFLQRETIKIRPDSVTIGGVEYSDVWLPHDCADKFRTNAFDFITRYNIASESYGTFVSGVGFLDGIPYFNVNGSYRTQNYVFPFSSGVFPVGNGRFSVEDYGAGQLIIRYYSSSGSVYTAGPGLVSSYYPISLFISSNSSGGSVQSNYIQSGYSSYGRISWIGFPSSLFVSSSFDFDYVSGSIPAVPLASSDGLRIRIPSSYVAGLPQILDPDSSSYDDDLASLSSSLTSAGESGDIIESAFEAWDTPVPGSGTIADEPYSSLSGSLNGIQSIINSISSSVSGIADSIVGADSSFFGNVVSALAAPFEPVFAIFRSGVGIWSYVVSWIGTISAPFSWSLSALGSAGGFFLSPIYASAAAAVVLAVYKKFGR